MTARLGDLVAGLAGRFAWSFWFYFWQAYRPMIYLASCKRLTGRNLAICGDSRHAAAARWDNAAVIALVRIWRDFRKIHRFTLPVTTRHASDTPGSPSRKGCRFSLLLSSRFLRLHWLACGHARYAHHLAGA